MNKIEKVVYDALKHNPIVKGFVRNIYQSAYDILPNKKNYFKNTVSIKEGYFFGFHDVSPFSFDNTKVLANHLTIPFRMPTKEDTLEVGYFPVTDEQLGNFQKIGETSAWNYHKGCRLQWAGKNKIIYNDFDKSGLVSKLHDLGNKSTRTISYPIDSVSPCGKYAATFSFGRLEMTMPGYGYLHDDESFKSEKVPSRTGLFLSDLEAGSTELVVSLQKLFNGGGLKKHPIKDAHQYVTHTLFSPDGRYISFLYRATNKDNILKRWSQLVVYDLETGNLNFASTDEMVSHYVWNTKNQIVTYCRIDGIDSHVLFDSPSLDSYKRVAYPKLNSDGHQSFVTDSKFVTDTYPDKFRIAKLYVVDTTTDEATLIASVNSPKRYQSKPLKHWCCDLHPRMSHQGTTVCFDSVHTGERALCIMKI